jgi:sporulation protein YlmC with PRC-barrel domain
MKDREMPKHIQTSAYAVAIGLGLLGVSGLPIQAQTTNTTSATTSTNSDRAPNGSLEKYHGKLRASELTGANVYNDHGTALGTVNDLLVGNDGKIQNVVLSVGGLLGVGTHYVSVPFSQIQVEPSHSGGTDSTATNGMTGTNGTMTTGTPNATVTPATSTGARGTGMATNTSSMQYFSIVLPGATKDSLTKMPEYNYRS